MPGDAHATRRRLLDAATAEFAAHGIAGARVDRIAEQAGSNKAQIYHYFGSKDGLFDAVVDQFVGDTVRDTPIDPLDLPEYAGRLFDRFEERPYIPRLATWHRLERGAGGAIDAIVRSNADKVAALEKAQAAGDLPDRFAAVDLLALVLAVARTWTDTPAEYGVLLADHDRARRRRVVVEGVRALVAPAA